MHSITVLYSVHNPYGQNHGLVWGPQRFPQYIFADFVLLPSSNQDLHHALGPTGVSVAKLKSMEKVLVPLVEEFKYLGVCVRDDR